jgi:citrate synthase
MGEVTFTELAFLLVQRRMPSAEETRLLDAVLVSLADHGLTPSALAARLTYTGAPESMQGAVAAGLVDVGIPPTSVRGVVLVARTAGLVAHLTEEVEAPIGMSLGHDVERRASP